VVYFAPAAREGDRLPTGFRPRDEAQALAHVRAEGAEGAVGAAEKILSQTRQGRCRPTTPSNVKTKLVDRRYPVTLARPLTFEYDLPFCWGGSTQEPLVSE
jgi:hypothetical protein